MTPPSPRILITTDTVGGVWVHSSSLARALCRRGCHVDLVTLGPAPRREQVQSLGDDGDLELIVTDLALEWMDPEGQDLSRALTELIEIERRAKPDIIHLNSYREAVGEWHAPVLVVAHSCVRSWWQACHGGDPSDTEWLTYVDNVRAGLAAADRWSAPSGAFRDTIQELYGPPVPGRVIWNGLARSRPPRAKQPVIMAGGRLWDAAKNIRMLAAAAARVPWPLRIAGPLDSSVSPTDAAAPMDGVELLGDLPRQQFLDEMRRASIFAAPAIYEPFGLSVLEAAVAGCALVLADIETFRELWDGAAMFVPPRDPEKWRAALTKLSRDDVRRRDLQRRAAERARRYSLAAMTDAYLGLYATMQQRREARATAEAVREPHEARQ